MPPVSPPMMINVKQCMVHEIFLYFNGGTKKKVCEPLVYHTDPGWKKWAWIMWYEAIPKLLNNRFTLLNTELNDKQTIKQITCLQVRRLYLTLKQTIFYSVLLQPWMVLLCLMWVNLHECACACACACVCVCVYKNLKKKSYKWYMWLWRDNWFLFNNIRMLQILMIVLF
jgi:hypothetical protein